MKVTLWCVGAVVFSRPHRFTGIEEALFQSCASLIARRECFFDSVVSPCSSCVAADYQCEVIAILNAYHTVRRSSLLHPLAFTDGISTRQLYPASLAIVPLLSAASLAHPVSIAVECGNKAAT